MTLTSSTSTGPAQWASDVVLLDGGTAHVRPIEPADGEALVASHGRLSEDTVHARFFSSKPTLSAAEVERFTHVDHDDRVALVAELGDRLVGVARYDRTAGEREAEVAFVVADEHQGRGIGTVLLELGSQPLPAGRRVAIVGNSGGPGILASDACAAAGLEVRELSPETPTGFEPASPP